MTSTLTQQWLRQVIGPYNDKDRIYTDIDNVLSTFINALRPKTDVYTFDDGRQQLLLCIHGLLPIAFRQASYNIPVSIWIPLNYPRDVPIAYVVPTSDMLVKASPNVDTSGRCQTDYLKAWERKSEGCTLQGLVESLQEVFSREPPVYAKPKSSSVSSISQPTSVVPESPSRASPQAQQSPARVTLPTAPPPAISGPPPVPPVPSGFQSPLAAPSLTADGRPMPPPRPSIASPFAAPEASTLIMPGTPVTMGHRPPPPLPGEPQPQSPQLPQRPTSKPPPPPWAQAFQSPSTTGSPIHTHAGAPHRPTSSVSGYTPLTALQPQFSGGPGYPTPANQRWATPLSPSSTGPASQTVAPAPPPLPPAVETPIQVQFPTHYTPYAPQLPPPIGNPTQMLRQPSQAARAPVQDLMDAEDDGIESALPLQDLAPPKSMNPELLRLHEAVRQKLLTELQTFNATVTEDAERLRAQQADLLHGEPAIRDEMARLVAVRDVCRSVSERLRSTVRAAEVNVQDLKRKGDPELDELVCSTTIVYNQLVNLVAEDNAIEDTTYHLHRALNSGRIDLDRFIRTTRILAEEQFMKRALIQKITSGIPMGAATSWS